MPMLGPDATGVGWVMQYILADTTGTHDLADLRALQDFVRCGPRSTAVPGVAEIASSAASRSEYQVTVDPAKLLAFDVPISEVADAVRRIRTRTSAGACSRWAAREYVVRGRGRFASLDDIRGVVRRHGAGRHAGHGRRRGRRAASGRRSGAASPT